MATTTDTGTDQDTSQCAPARPPTPTPQADPTPSDTGASAAVVPVPVESPRTTTTRRKSEASDATTSQESQDESSTQQPATAFAPLRWLRIAAGTAYRALDVILDRINHPFAWVPDGVRQIVGFLALATLTISLLAGIGLPLVSRGHHPASSLRTAATAVREAPPAADHP